MTRNKLFLFVALLTAVALSSCSGAHNVCTSNCGGGTGTISVTLVSDTLPSHPAIISYEVVVTGISLKTSSGTQAVTFSGTQKIDLMRIQSDSAFLGSFGNIPAGQYTGITLSISSAAVTFFNDTGAAITNGSNACPNGAICNAVGVAAVPSATLNFSVASNAVTGLAVDFDLANTVSLTGTSFVTLAATNVASAFKLPRAGGNFTASQLDLIEDFTGVATVSGSTVTIKSPTRGTLAATANSNTIYDQDPSGALCVARTTLSTCVSNNQVVSADALLNSDGTMTLQEIEPLLSAPQDTVEGIVTFLPASATQFGIIVTDVPSVATSNSLIGSSLNIGDALTLNLSGFHPFQVDTKGLAVNTFGSYADFNGKTTAGASGDIHFGQTVAVHVTSFTAATSSANAIANTDTVILRWTRIIATASTQGTTSLLNINNLPSYFGFASSASFVVQLFQGTQWTKGVTNFDGVTSGTGVNASQPVALRALFFEDAGNAANPAFFAAKVRVP
jgi:hypothetical protein